ncbi:MAG: FMN-binding protein [Candidatus Omnitrophica bacterium]|nr:FMN-binding protein [Candidatus Omnitrophota bacterium]
MILFVLILGSSLTTALVAVDRFTAGPIARNEAIKLQKGILSSLSIEYGPDDIDEKYSANIEVIITDGEKPKNFYRSKISGDIAFEISGTGLQGAIHATIALSPDLERISGLSIVKQEETPGLGGRIAEDEFLDQFKGKAISNGLAILSPGKAKADNEVDGITGATLSCNALEELLNSEIKKYVLMFRESK